MTGINRINPATAVNKGRPAGYDKIKSGPSIISLSRVVPLHCSAIEYLKNHRGSADNILNDISHLHGDLVSMTHAVSLITRGLLTVKQINYEGRDVPILMKPNPFFGSGPISFLFNGEMIQAEFSGTGAAGAAAHHEFPPVDIKVKKIDAPGTGKAEMTFKASVLTPGVCLGYAVKAVSTSVQSLRDYPEEDLKAIAGSKNVDLDGLVEARMKAYEIAAEKMFEKKEALFQKLAEKIPLDAGAFLVQKFMIMDFKDGVLRTMKDEKIGASAASKKFMTEYVKRIQKAGSGGDLFNKQGIEDLEKVMLEVLQMKHNRHIDVNGMINASGLSPVVLFAHAAKVDAAMWNDKMCAVVKTEGGQGGHEVIYARSNEKIYAIDAPDAVNAVKDGDTVIVDFTENTITINPSKEAIGAASQKRGIIDHAKAGFADLRGTQVVNPITGRAMKFMINALMAQEIKEAAHGSKTQGVRSADGAGLVRTEEFFGKTLEDPIVIDRDRQPTVDEQVRYYDSLTQYSGEGGDRFPVTVRTLDIIARSSSDPEKAGDKELSYIRPVVDDPKKADGLPLCLNRNTPVYLIFRDQVEALVRSKIKYVMFPGVRTKEQFDEALGIFKEVEAGLRSRGVETGNEKVFGLMIENGDIIRDLEGLLQSGKVSFLSIGTNDLTTDLTGVARDSNLQKQYRSQIYSPAVGEALIKVRELSERFNVPVRTCGDHVNDWPTLLFQMSLGYESFSFSNVFEADIARKVASVTDKEGLEKLLKLLDQIRSQYEIHGYIEEYLYDMARTKAWDIDEQTMEFLKIWSKKTR